MLTNRSAVIPLAPTFDGTARALHWSLAALLAVQFVTAALLPDIKVDTPLQPIITVHFSIGIVIAVVMAIRLVHRWLHTVPVAPRTAPPWERNLARATHRTFYAVLLAGPFLGWASASAHGIPVHLFGLVHLRALVPRKAEWGFVAGDVHGYGMWALLALVAVHALVALNHHFVRRDEVLQRILPGNSSIR